jgi:hypothetical protein
MTPEQRRKQIGRIHQAKKLLGLNEADYRKLLDSLTGCDSCAKMDDRRINHALDWMFYMAGKRRRMPALWGKYKNDTRANLVRLCYALKAIVPDGYQKSPLTSMTWQERTCGRCAAYFEEMTDGEMMKLIEGVKMILDRTGNSQFKRESTGHSGVRPMGCIDGNVRVGFSNAV